MLLNSIERVIENPSSPLSFVNEGGGSWPQWDRYLAIDGKKAFHIGNVCGTCSFFFERLEGANRSVDATPVVEALNAGLQSLDEGLLSKLEMIIPSGKYLVLLSRIRPTLVVPSGNGDYFKEEQVALWGVDGFWGLPHHPKTEYYRLAAKTLHDQRGFFEFLIPTFPHGWLESKRIADYNAALDAGQAPTAVALSVVDLKAPATYDGDPSVVEHLCLAHYLIDGHHKAYTAALTGRPITLVSFLATEHGVADEDTIAAALDALNA